MPRNQSASPAADQPLLACYVVTAVTILAPLLGGSTKIWAEAVLTVCAGLIFLLFPPRKSLPLSLNIGFALLFLLGLTGFLPVDWFPPAKWRTELTAIGAELPGTISPQPWLTLQSALLLFVGLSWAYYLLAAGWSLPARQKSWRLLGLAFTGLAAMLILAFVFRYRIPFWPNTPQFGFFDNRNHTANVLGLGGILVYALAFRALDEGRRNWWSWVIAFACIFWALVVNYSRAGIILLFGGVLLWQIGWLITSRRKRIPLITLVSAGLLLVFFAVGGGETALRFGRETPQMFSVTEDGRFGIFRSAAEVSARAPLTGAGLANFSPIFTMNRYDSDTSIAGHPESDWLWIAVEMGWIAPLVLAGCLVIYALRCFPFEPGTMRLMRLAAFICGAGFVLHSFFDVPGHQLGALWPGLFLASTATHPNARFVPSRRISILFRGLGVLCLAIGVWWLASIFGVRTFPTTATLRRSLHELEGARQEEDYAAMLNLASQALRIAPLNWELYYDRGLAEAFLYRPRAEIQRDFAAAIYLLPNWADLSLKEGQVWLAVGEPDLAFAVWQQAMERSPRQAMTLYGQIFELIKDDPALRDQWRELAKTRSAPVLLFLQNAAPAEFQIELDRILLDDPELRSFSELQRKSLFEAWYRRGDKLALAETLRQHPDWEKIAWRQLARIFGEYQDYRQAYEVAAQHAPPAQLPEPNTGDSIESLTRRFQAGGRNPQDGLMLAVAQAKSGELDDALAILTVISQDPHAPGSVHFLAAQLWARKSDWLKAWQSISKYAPIQD